ncbi:MAG: hypothetical protein NT019_00425 [Candidatus Adlerbacteria bacterium]|nr:hypothetical protein [Candidatus Adlerbacteria bacterium]
MKKFLLVSISLLLIPYAAFAHTTGKSVEQIVGKYLLDVGYSPDPVVAGDSTYFDFKIYQNGPTPGDAPYRNVWVRIYQDNGTLFAAGIAHMDAGPTGLVYTFAAPGVYSVSVRYETADDTLGEATFQIPVAAGDTTKYVWFWYVVSGVAGFCMGASGLYVYARKKKLLTRGIL